MDRQLVYPGQIPLETDILNQAKHTMLGLGEFIRAVMGTPGVVGGLEVLPDSPTSLNVQVTAGSVYSYVAIDTEPYGSIAANPSNNTMKQGLLRETAELTLVPPGTSGHAINYLVQVGFQETDEDPITLPYYNSEDPEQPFTGPENSGVAQMTMRRCNAILSAKAGVSATAGTQVTPSPDAGYLALARVTVAFGASQLTTAEIKVLATSAYLLATLPQIPYRVQDGRWLYGLDSGTANALVVTCDPPVTLLRPGMTLHIKKNTSANTGAVTLNVDGLGASAVKRSGGAALEADDLPANAMFAVMWDGSQWQMPNYFGRDAGSTTTETYTLDIPYAADSGVANVIVATFSPALTSLAAGDLVMVKMAAANTGATTLNPNGLGAVAVKRPGGATLQSGDLAAGHVGLFRYDGTNFQVEPSLVEFMASGASARQGLVPAPPGTAGATKYLREDKSWAVPTTLPSSFGDIGTNIVVNGNFAGTTSLNGNQIIEESGMPGMYVKSMGSSGIIFTGVWTRRSLIIDHFISTGAGVTTSSAALFQRIS